MDVLLVAAKKEEIQDLVNLVSEARLRPRVIDLDLLLYGDKIIAEPNLHVPHPLMHERRFVIEPLVEIAPDVVHPVLKKTMRELLNAWV